jgi:hypothetical protein
LFLCHGVPFALIVEHKKGHKEQIPCGISRLAIRLPSGNLNAYPDPIVFPLNRQWSGIDMEWTQTTICTIGPVLPVFT